MGPRAWFRVIRHEVFMGVLLGITLGLIGFVRASFTPERLRASSPPRDEAFHVVTDKDNRLTVEDHKEGVRVTIPPGAEQHIEVPKGESVVISLPEGDRLAAWEEEEGGKLIYRFPEKCYIPRKPVPRFGLATVIALAVAGICLWGTLIGSMLPIIFKRLGADPALASSPFVATFVDVTGIVIYFSIASVIVL